MSAAVLAAVAATETEAFFAGGFSDLQERCFFENFLTFLFFFLLEFCLCLLLFRRCDREV